MTTMRIDTEDFRQFIDWLIKEEHIQDRWDHIRDVYKEPLVWMAEYLRFQKETYEPDVVIEEILLDDPELAIPPEKDERLIT